MTGRRFRADRGGTRRPGVTVVTSVSGTGGIAPAGPGGVLVLETPGGDRSRPAAGSHQAREVNDDLRAF
ncbi:hypothetical protein GCM10010129_66970 [Streptomyces fumigatiscleroticus]|nr:hypothetical protein GCM10010129_66970 [Streptomyces fumigatiscleroticus]